MMPAPLPTTDLLAHPRLLLVDDDMVIQQLTELYIKRLGYAFDTVSTGLEAVEAAARYPYALILMDCLMPVMDGLEATRLIRQAEGNSGRHVPIVALTANTLTSDRAVCLAAGMDDYLAKPIVARKLADVVKHWVERGSVQGDKIEVELSEVQAASRYESIDATAFASLRRLLSTGNSEFFGKSIDSFLVNTAGLISTLQLATEQQDVNELYRAAHTLKSSSATFCAPRLAALCSDLELAAKAGLPQSAIQHIALIEAEFSNVRKALEAERS